MKKRVLSAWALAAACMTSGAQAGVLYATDNFDLFRLDKTTGQASLVGNMVSSTGFQNMIDMSSVGSTLYGLMREQAPDGSSSSRLVSIDASTGAIAQLPTITGLFATGTRPSRHMQTIAYDSVTGKMYGANTGPDRSLYSIDLTTGVASRLAASPIAAGTNQPSLGFDDLGQLFSASVFNNEISTLLRVNLDGTQTSFGTALNDASIADFAFDADDQTLYAATFSVVPGNPPSSEAGLWTADRSTGALTLRGNYAPAGGWSGLAVIPGGGSVPEPAALLLACTALLMLRMSRR